MDGQITLMEYMNTLQDVSHDRYGREYKAPQWMNRERCENYKWWERLPVEEQPPAGWGVNGQCNCTHEPEMMKNGYWIVGKTSYCNDFVSKFEG